ncbi:hypothetical protein AB0M43_01040 [Longispora sp. NPDC051575]|uniref:hypothetical protein n=1 Tax=Longispora sp. NPDC051575 TaxID=3154943 RepID=UPI00343D8E16
MAEPSEARQVARINARSVIVAATVTAVCGVLGVVWTSLYTTSSSSAPGDGRRASTPATPSAPTGSPSPAPSAPTGGTGAAPPTLSPVPPPALAAPSPGAPVDRPLVGGPCVPGTWKLQRLDGRPRDGNTTVNLVSEGYKMTFDPGGTGTMTMPATGVWYAGWDAGHSVKYRTVGSSTFHWRVVDGKLSLTPGSSSLVTTVYRDDVDQGSGPDKLPDLTETFDCSGNGLRLADDRGSSDLTRI